jgi:uncharacterized membrane protein YfcA
MIYHSTIETVYYILPVLGFAVGLFGTILGGGGGFFFLPALTLIIGAPAQTAVITSLVATLPVCMVGSAGHYRKGNINWQIGLIFSIAGIAGAFAGTAITGLISNETLKIAFGIYSVLIALKMGVDTWKKQYNSTNKNQQHSGKRISQRLKGPVYGFFAGTITGTFGTSGTAPVLAGLFSLNIPLKLVIGTSLMIVLINTTFAIGAHALVGQVDLTLVEFLTAGSAAGALLGPKILSAINTDKSESKFRYVYALVMIIIGIFMITD